MDGIGAMFWHLCTDAFYLGQMWKKSSGVWLKFSYGDMLRETKNPSAKTDLNMSGESVFGLM